MLVLKKRLYLLTVQNQTFMTNSIYDEIGGFAKLRNIITSFYDNVLEIDELATLFEGANMERLIDHQTKFFTSLLGGPISFTDDEIKHAHMRLNINSERFEMTKDCLEDTLNDFDLSDEHVKAILAAFEGKRELIVH